MPKCEPSGISGAHLDDGKRFVVHADEMLTAFLELDGAPANHLRFLNTGRLGTNRAVQPFDRFSLGRAGSRLQDAV
jgi:hypothetical protein